MFIDKLSSHSKYRCKETIRKGRMLRIFKKRWQFIEGITLPDLDSAKRVSAENQDPGRDPLEWWPVS